MGESMLGKIRSDCRNTVVVALLVLLISACTAGHDTSNDNSGNNSSSTTTGPTTSSATRVDLIASSPTLDSSAIKDSGGVTLTAIVRDANNNGVPSPQVSFQASSGRIVAGSSNSAGTATAMLYNDPDRADRDIAVTATLGGLSDSQTISATGTTLSLTGPASVAPGDRATFQVLLRGSDGQPIARAPVKVSPAASITPLNGTLDTDASGEVRFAFSSDQRQTVDVTAKARGASATKSISVDGNGLAFVGTVESAEVGHEIPLSVHDLNENGQPIAGQTISFSASRGQLSAPSATTDNSGIANIQLTATVAGDVNVIASTDNGQQTAQRVRFTAANPATLVLNASPTTLAPRDTSQITAALFDKYGNPVTGRDVDFRLAASSPGSLSEARVTTDDSGIASTTYTAGPTSTSDDIKVTASAVDDATVLDTATLRVAGKPLAITLGTGGAPKLSSDGTTYSTPYAVLVTDAAGNPVSSADLQLRVRALSYQAANQEQPLCLNEDTNNDGILEPSEDRNKDGRLEPGQVASVPSAPSLDDSGTARFDVTYLSRYANLVKVRLTATANVAGSQNSQAIDFDLKGTSSSDADPFPAPCSAG